MGDNQSENIEEGEENVYLPVYNDVNDEFLNRPTYSFFTEEPREEVKEYKETVEYPVMLPLDGRKVTSVHYTIHVAEEPSGLREDVDMYEPISEEEEEDESQLYKNADETTYEDASQNKDLEDNFADAGEN